MVRLHFCVEWNGKVFMNNVKIFKTIVVYFRIIFSSYETKLIMNMIRHIMGVYV